MAPPTDRPQMLLTKSKLPICVICLIVAMILFVAQASNDAEKISPKSKQINSQQHSIDLSSSVLYKPASKSIASLHRAVNSNKTNSSLHKSKLDNYTSNQQLSLCPVKTKWTVKIQGGSREANEIANSLGFNNLGLVRGFLQTYLFEKRCSANLMRDKRDFVETTDKLNLHKDVVWAEQQTILTRVRRSSPSPADLSASLSSGHLAVYEANTQGDESGQPRHRHPRSLMVAQADQQRPPPLNPSGPVQIVYDERGPAQAGSVYVQPNGRPIQQQPLQLKPMTESVIQTQPMTTSNGRHGNANSPRPQLQQSLHVQQASSTGRMIAANWHLVLGTSGPGPTRPFVASKPAAQVAANQAANLPQHVASVNHFATVHIVTAYNNGQQAHSGHLVSTTGQNTTGQNTGAQNSLHAASASGASSDKLLQTTTAANRYDDELWTHQWYLQDNSQDNGMSLHVQEVWQMGFTGKNVVVTVIDDGLEWNHTDLIGNYDSMASYDMNNNRPNPYPRYDSLNKQNHGTRCAGEIAMQANNKKCGIGVAPNARIGGIKILDGEIDEHIEAMSLIHNLHHIDIYSASWGPNDDGMTVEGPKLTQAQALRDGIERGRRGLGAIYIWASGNGGKDGDNCNCDGYVSSLYTIAIGSATQRGYFPYFGERCASIMAVTCSSGTLTDKKVTTTDLHNRCTTNFVGTSAAAPLAAGIMALVLEANPNITWRDAQHLVAWNCDYYPLRDNTGWFRNSAELMYNNKFGFGLMNGKLLVESALTWQNVPPKSICTIVADGDVLPETISTGAPAPVLVQFHTDNCQIETNHDGKAINYLEHVELIATIEYPTRGDLEIFLSSPTGTTSNLLTYRPRDKAMIGFTDWSFMSVHFWGERPQGTWTLQVRDKHRGQSKINNGYLVNATLLLHGTTTKPAHMNRARIYDGENKIKETLEKSIVRVDPATGLKTHDENPWDPMYFNEMSPVSNEEREDRQVRARMP